MKPGPIMQNRFTLLFMWRAMLIKNRSPLPLFLFLALTACGGDGTENFSGPRVMETHPAPGATGVPFSEPIEATLSKGIDPATINTDTFILTGVSSEVTYQNGKAVLTPSIPLVDGTTYHAVLTTGIRDLDGVPLSENFIWSFTTGTSDGVGPNPPPPVLDLSPPVILSTAPGDGEIGVAVNSAIQAVFNEEVDEQNLSSNFVLHGPGGGEIASSIRYDSGARSATLTPSTTLQPETTYQAIVRRGVSDLGGNALAADVRWSFTTVKRDAPPPPPPPPPPPAVEEERPEVIERQPIGIDIPLESFITVRFSKAIRPETLAGNFMITTRGRTISAEIGYNISSNTATMIPSRLRHGTTYTVVLTDDIRDLAGNRLEHTSWSFRTVNRPDDDDDD